eukprot:357713-Chlamydomonas_euryale.AAC.15
MGHPEEPGGRRRRRPRRQGLLTARRCSRHHPLPGAARPAPAPQARARCRRSCPLRHPWRALRPLLPPPQLAPVCTAQTWASPRSTPASAAPGGEAAAAADDDDVAAAAASAAACEVAAADAAAAKPSAPPRLPLAPTPCRAAEPAAQLVAPPLGSLPLARSVRAH